MDQQQVERLRNARFTVARRGYDQREVDHFMVDLAEWLENGGFEEAGSFAVKRQLERAGETTARVLSTAQSEAEKIVEEADEEAREIVGRANETARKKLEQTRAEVHDLVEEAEHKRDEIRATIAQLTDVQRRVVADLGQLRDALAAAVAEVPAPAATPANANAASADGDD